ncbi:MAG: hypothetical protein ACRDDY_02655 [Clostridium sp.]|uniref:hypothetical protein n=1 Tax=Clostridium sp. TaxID=1506 RepID=UPI003EE7D503
MKRSIREKLIINIMQLEGRKVDITGSGIVETFAMTSIGAEEIEMYCEEEGLRVSRLENSLIIRYAKKNIVICKILITIPIQVVEDIEVNAEVVNNEVAAEVEKVDLNNLTPIEEYVKNLVIIEALEEKAKNKGYLRGLKVRFNSETYEARYLNSTDAVIIKGTEYKDFRFRVIKDYKEVFCIQVEAKRGVEEDEWIFDYEGSYFIYRKRKAFTTEYEYKQVKNILLELQEEERDVLLEMYREYLNK